MRVSPLNLISTPLPVLNTLGLDLRVGLSSEDPMVLRHPSETYESYLSIYSPEGLLTDRVHLGQIPPNRRRFFDVTEATRRLVPSQDHLSVVHRIPSRLLAQDSSQIPNLEEEIELDGEPDYSLFRSLVEFSYPHGGNGSVIYETPHRLNPGTPGSGSSNTLTFTCQTLLSQTVDSYAVLIHYSVNPAYSRVAHYEFAFHALSGERVASERVALGPFSIKVLDVRQIIPPAVVAREADPQDGISAFTFVGYSEDASILVMVVNAAPSLGSVSVEHTHPPQTYLLPLDPSYQRQVKKEAQAGWKALLSHGGEG